MPHCIIEYSKPVEDKIYINDLLLKLHETMKSSEMFDSSSIKTRALAYEHYIVGDENKEFFAITVKLLSGRTNDIKKKLSAALQQTARSMLSEDIVLTVDIRDLNSEAYRKGK